jgi:hypothetical protein
MTKKLKRILSDVIVEEALDTDLKSTYPDYPESTPVKFAVTPLSSKDYSQSDAVENHIDEVVDTTKYKVIKMSRGKRDETIATGTVVECTEAKIEYERKTGRSEVYVLKIVVDRSKG